MASEAQILANRLNAQKSTGPRTPEGKAIVSQNAVKHGLCGRQAVIVGEDIGEFELYRDRMLGELAPVGQMESVLAERVVSLSWRLRRAERLQNETFDVLHFHRVSGPLAPLAQPLVPIRPGTETGNDDLALGRIACRDFANARVLDRLLMYERRIEHSLYRTIAELRKLRLSKDCDRPAEERTPRLLNQGRDDPPRETKPISACRYAETPARCGITARHGDPHPFAGPVGREPGGECVRQSRPGGTWMNCRSEGTVWEHRQTRQDSTELDKSGCLAGRGSAGHEERPAGWQRPSHAAAGVPAIAKPCGPDAAGLGHGMQVRTNVLKSLA